MNYFMPCFRNLSSVVITSHPLTVDLYDVNIPFFQPRDQNGRQ